MILKIGTLWTVLVFLCFTGGCVHGSGKAHGEHQSEKAPELTTEPDTGTQTVDDSIENLETYGEITEKGSYYPWLSPSP